MLFGKSLSVNKCVHTYTYTHTRANERRDEHATHARREHTHTHKTKEPAYLRRFNRVSSVFIRLLLFVRRETVSSPSLRAREQREVIKKKRREDKKNANFAAHIWQETVKPVQ